MRIKYIIIVTDNAIAKQADIQAHLKRTYPVFFRKRLQYIPCIIDLCGQQVEQCRINAIKVSLCIGTDFRIAFRIFQKTDFIFRSQQHYLKCQPSFPQQGKVFIRHCSGNGLGSQIKQFLRLSLPNRLDGRKNGGNCFSHAGRRFQKEFPFMANGSVDPCRQFLLALPIGKGESQCPQGSLPFLFPVKFHICPFPVLAHQIQKPLLQP